MKRLLFTIAAACALVPSTAQETLTLGQCISMGIENNLQLKTARNEAAKGRHAVTENRAKLLPQINAVAQMADNFNPPVSVTDGSAYGKRRCSTTPRPDCSCRCRSTTKRCSRRSRLRS